MRYIAVVVLLVFISACISPGSDTQPHSTAHTITQNITPDEHSTTTTLESTSAVPGTGRAENSTPTSSSPNISANTSSPGSSWGKTRNETSNSSLGFMNLPGTSENLSLSSVRSWAYWLQNASPEVIAESGFDLVVMDYSRDGSDETAYTRGEIEKIKRAGVIPIAYISIGEAEDYRFYWNESWKENPPAWLGPENPDWEGNYAVRYWDEEWKEIVFRYLDRIIAQGFAGIYLDKVDEYWFWAEQGYNESWTAGQMIEFILEIANYTRSKAGRDFIIIPQNGEYLLEYDNGTLLATVSGWASEDVFYDGLEPSPWTAEKVPLLERVVSAGKPVFVVDYVDDGTRSEENLARILDFIEKARKAGFIPYATFEDRELDRLDVIPGIQPPK
ncbi:hypothetical protein E3E28_09870 [Thermococcus sp. 21S9]|nr:hypothetical protein [Thermococcus sp. 21S9]